MLTDYEIKKVGQHYEVHKCGKFYCSCDTIRECQHEIDDAWAEEVENESNSSVS